MSSPAEDYVKERNRRFRRLVELLREKLPKELVIDGRQLQPDEVAFMLRDVSLPMLVNVGFDFPEPTGSESSKQKVTIYNKGMREGSNDDEK
jgi:hypothetical protein